MSGPKKIIEVSITKDDGSNEIKRIYVDRPNNNAIKLADRYKAKVWNDCLKDGILTKKELVVVMEKRGLWNGTKDKEQETITNRIIDLEKNLYKGISISGKRLKLSEGRDMAIDIRRARLELRNLIHQRISMEENTAESISDNARFDCVVAECTFYENGTKVYKNIEEYNQNSSDETAYAAASELADMMFSLEKDFEKNLPENKWLSKFNLVNDELRLVDKDKDLVDVNGKRIDVNGFYRDEDNKRIDVDGNKMEEDGTYVMAEYEDDIFTTKTTKKTKPKETTESKENG